MFQNFFYRIAEPHGAVVVGDHGFRFVRWSEHNRTLRARGTSLPDEVAAGRCIKVDHIEYGRETGLGIDHLERDILVLDQLSLTLLVAQAMRDGFSDKQIERLITNPCMDEAGDDAERAIRAIIEGAKPCDIFEREIDTRIKAIRPSKR